MIDEMELVHMDERQRGAWLLANRATVIAVGVTWLAMIVWELAHDRAPRFLIVMVPVFALFRLVLYLYYLRVPRAASRGDTVSRSIRVGAAVLLLVAAVVPSFRFEDRSEAAWELVRGDWGAVIPIAFVFLWPIPVLLLSRRRKTGKLAVVLHFAEPVVAATSTLAILWLPQMIWEFDSTFAPWLWIPKSVGIEIGVPLAAAANGLYVVGWMLGALRTTAP